MSFVEVRNAWKKINDEDVVIGDNYMKLLDAKQSTYHHEAEYDHWHGSRRFPICGFTARCVELKFVPTTSVYALTYGDLEPTSMAHVPYTVHKLYDSLESFEKDWVTLSDLIDNELVFDRQWKIDEYVVVDKVFVMKGVVANPKTSKQLKSAFF